MGASIVAAATNTATGATSIVVNKPTGTQDGDLMIAIFAVDKAAGPTTLAGWTLCAVSQRINSVNVATYSASTAPGGSGFYWKVANSEGSSYTWSGFTSGNIIGTIITLRGITAQQIGGAFSAAMAFDSTRPMALSGSTIKTDASSGVPIPGEMTADSEIMIAAFVHNVTTTVVNLSGLSGTMTQQSYNTLSGVACLVATEITDATANPDYGSRQVSSDSSSGVGRGFILYIANPSQLTTVNTKPPRGMGAN